MLTSFTMEDAKEIEYQWFMRGLTPENACTFVLPGNDTFVLKEDADEYEIQTDDATYIGKDIEMLSNGIRFILEDGSTRTYLCNTEVM